jgi:NTP pyrophosphatase (non-canonical NTP hydrolase)
MLLIRLFPLMPNFSQPGSPGHITEDHVDSKSDYDVIKSGLHAYQSFTTNTAVVYRSAPLIAHAEVDGISSSPLMELAYCLGKLAGEAGEAGEKFWKFMRDERDPFTGRYEPILIVSEEVRGQIVAELGDVLWYVAQAARCLDVSLGDVGIGNLEKLRGRAERGVLGGSGDDR